MITLFGYDLIQIIAGLVCAMIGSKLPDIDLAPVFPFRHRSAWTHGPLLAAVTWWAAGRWPYWQLAAVGLLAGMTVHLLADAFPRKWSGSAFINLAPLRGSLPAPLSFAYIVFSAAASGLAAAMLLGWISGG